MNVGPPTLELIVDRGLRGVRIDSFLAKHLRNYSTWKLARIVRAGGVQIDHAPVDETRRVVAGDRVQVRLLEPPDHLHLSEPPDIRVVYHDSWLVVVDKPAGLIAHPTGDYQTGVLTNVLQSFVDELTPLPGLLRAGIVHRLDRQTSGVMVVALTHDAHAALSSAFEHGRVSKTYVALVEGVIDRPQGVIDLPIGRSRAGRGVLMSARADAVDRRPATTRYEVLRRYPRHTLVAARPLSGRNHQIRVHFAHIGHPLVGDEFYLALGAIRTERSRVRAELSRLAIDPVEVVDDEAGLEWEGRHALHAARLELAHPITGVWLTFSAGLPADMQQMIASVSE